MPFHQICGLTVASDIPLQAVLGEAAPVQAPDAPDVHIRQTAVPSELPGAGQCGPQWQKDAQQFLLSLPGLGRLLMREGREIQVEAAPGVSTEQLLPFILGSAMAVILYQRGRLVLHGSAVVFAGRAYVFCGPSGRGKSTLAAALCAAGCQFACDDLAAITVDAAGQPQLWPDGRQLKLLDNSIDCLQLQALRGQEVRAGLGKFYVQPQRPVSGPVPLGGIYLLREERLQQQLQLTAMSRVDAAQELLQESYRRKLVMALAMNAGGEHMRITAAIVHKVPVMQLQRPRDLQRLPEGVDLLLQHWRQAQ